MFREFAVRLPCRPRSSSRRWCPRASSPACPRGGSPAPSRASKAWTACCCWPSPEKRSRAQIDAFVAAVAGRLGAQEADRG